MVEKERRAISVRVSVRDDDVAVLSSLLVEVASSLSGATARRVECEHGLPPNTLEILELLSRAPGRALRMSELAAAASLSPSGLTRAIDRLSAAGLVERKPCPHDGRGSVAVLSPRGLSAVRAAAGRHRDALVRLVGGSLEKGERALLVALLERLRSSLAS